MNGRGRIDDPRHVRTQYSDPSNLSARARLHERFSTNDQGWIPWLIERLVAAPHGAILDVGGGPGFLWRDLSHLEGARRVVHTDLSPGMVATARRSIEDDRFAFLVANAEALPFAGGSVDVVVANHMLYHVPHVDRALSEFARVLRPGGRLLAATNGSRHMTQLGALVNREPFSIAGFDLDEGAAKLEQYFRDIRSEVFDDGLVVTEVQPLIDYIDSMADFWIGSAPVDELREHFAEVIAQQGAFRIDKHAGLFTAVPR